LDKRLVSLYVYYYIGIQFGGYLSAAFGAVLVGLAGHHYLAAKAFNFFKNALVVGGNYYIAEGFGFQGLLVNPAYHGFALNIHQRLSGKAGRGVAGGDYAGDFHIGSGRFNKYLKFISHGV
jgi:hypothetical protein